MAIFSTKADSVSMQDPARHNIISRIVQAMDLRALILYVILLAASLFFLFPMAWMTGTSRAWADGTFARLSGNSG